MFEREGCAKSETHQMRDAPPPIHHAWQIKHRPPSSHPSLSRYHDVYLVEGVVESFPNSLRLFSAPLLVEIIFSGLTSFSPLSLFGQQRCANSSSSRVRYSSANRRCMNAEAKERDRKWKLISAPSASASASVPSAAAETPQPYYRRKNGRKVRIFRRRPRPHLRRAHSNRHIEASAASEKEWLHYTYQFDPSLLDIEDYVDGFVLFEEELPSSADDGPSARFEHFLMVCEFVCEALRIQATTTTAGGAIGTARSIDPRRFGSVFARLITAAITMSVAALWAYAYRFHNYLLQRSVSTPIVL